MKLPPLRVTDPRKLPAFERRSGDTEQRGADDGRRRRRREFLIAMREHMMPGDQLPAVKDERDES
jgi:hypothetical protein